MAKKYARCNCDYSFAGLKRIIPTALDTVTIDHIQKFFRKTRDFHRAYIEGKTGIL